MRLERQSQHLPVHIDSSVNTLSLADVNMATFPVHMMDHAFFHPQQHEQRHQEILEFIKNYHNILGIPFSNDSLSSKNNKRSKPKAVTFDNKVKIQTFNTGAEPNQRLPKPHFQSLCNTTSLAPLTRAEIPRISVRQFLNNHTVIDPGNANGYLPYIRARIKAIQGFIHCSLLVDSGSTHNLCKVGWFYHLKTVMQVDTEKYFSELKTASQVGNCNIVGKANIPLIFTDTSSNEISLTLPFLIVTDLTNNMYLGQTFLASSVVQSLSKNYLSIQIESVNKKSLHNIPIEYKDSPTSGHMVSLMDMEIPAHSFENVDCKWHPNKMPTVGTCLLIDLPDRFDVPNLEHQIFPSIHLANQASVYTLNVHNPNPYPINLSDGQSIAIAKRQSPEDFLHFNNKENLYIYSNLFSRANPISSPSLSVKCNEAAFSEAAVKDLTNTLSKQQLTQNEIKQKVMDFKTNGYCDIDCSVFEDDDSKVTSFEAAKHKKVLTDEEIFDQIDLSHLTSDIQSYIKQGLSSRLQVFARHSFDVDICPYIQVKVDLKDDIPETAATKYIPPSIHVADLLDSALDDMVNNGLAVYCNEEDTFYPSNFLAVPKARDEKGNVIEIRVVYDSRIHNILSKRKHSSLLSYHELMTFLGQNSRLTTADLCQAYNCMPLDLQSSRLFTGYNSRRQKLRLTRAPMGWLNSNYYLSRLMSMLLSPEKLQNSTRAFADDLFCVTNKSQRHHVDILMSLLDRMIDFKLKIKPTKLKILKSTCDILGLTWEVGRLSIPKSRILSFQKISEPKNLKETRQFVYLANFYRNFIPEFSEIARPLHDLSKKHHKSFKFGEEQRKSFLALKKSMMESTAMYIPNPAQPFYIFADSSEYASAVALMQPDEQHNLKMVACHSKMFSSSEQNLHIFRKELLGIVNAFATYRIFLEGAKDIYLFCDIKALKTLILAKGTPVLVRLAVKIAAYRPHIVHLRSKEHMVADIFSRAIKKPGLKASDFKPMGELEAIALVEKTDIPEFSHIKANELQAALLGPGATSAIHPLKPNVASGSKPQHLMVEPDIVRYKKQRIPQVVRTHPFERYKAQSHQSVAIMPTQDNNFLLNASILVNGLISVDQFIEAQRCDPFCQQLMQKVPRDYLLRKNILIRVTNGKERLVLPKSLLQHLMFGMHYGSTGGHASKTTMHKQLSELYYYPNLEAILDEYTKSCYFCNKHVTPTTKQQAFGQLEVASQPRLAWSIDLLTGLPTTINKYRYLMVAVDQCSLYVTLIPLKSKSSGDLLNAVKNNIIKPFMKPQVLHCDGESGICSKEFIEYCDKHEIKLETTPFHSSFSNSLAELTVKKAKKLLRLYCNQTSQSWATDLEILTNILNERVTTYNHSPEEVFFGNSIIKSSNLLNAIEAAGSVKDFVQKVKSKMDKRLQQSSALRQSRNSYFRDRVNKSRTGKTFSENDIVFIRDFSIAEVEGGSLKAPFLGPMAVLDVDEERLTCTVTPLTGQGRDRKCHFNHMKHVQSKLHPHPTLKVNEALQLLRNTPQSPSESPLHSDAAAKYNLRPRK